MRTPLLIWPVLFIYWPVSGEENWPMLSLGHTLAFLTLALLKDFSPLSKCLYPLYPFA